MNLGKTGLGRLIQRDLARIVQREELNTTEVVAFWNTAEPIDPNLEAQYPAAVPQSGTLTALVHFVQPVKSGVRMFAEVQPGDVIVDFLQDVELPGTAWFLIDGTRYVQKDAGKELSEYWDLVIGGERMMRTLLLTKHQ